MPTRALPQMPPRRLSDAGYEFKPPRLEAALHGLIPCRNGPGSGRCIC
ncbi:MAG: DUF1731 domain-containing protein [Planctomycetes bacterium]|nr:DUF1731 domain-containing protein [Planctomycetota bacterium]